LCVYDGKQNVRAVWCTTENGLDELTKKYVGGKVSKEFVDGDDDHLRKYIGEVTHVHFVRSESQYQKNVFKIISNATEHTHLSFRLK